MSKTVDGQGRNPRRYRKKRSKKPDFIPGESLLSSASFSALFRRFRDGGLGLADAFFNALYTAVSEKNVKKMEERMRREGAEPTAEHRNSVHSATLRFFSAVLRFFRGIFDGVRRLGNRIFHRDPGGSTYRNSYRFFRSHIPHFAVAAIGLVCLLTVVLILSTPVVLKAEIDGKVIGAVESNTVVESAIHDLEENVSGILGKDFRFPFEVRYTFARDRRAKAIDKSEISEILYSYLPDYICTGAGLYVDDTLVTVCETEQEIREELELLTQEHIETDGNVGILNEIRVVTQAYPSGSVISRDDLHKLLEEMTVSLEERGGTVREETGTVAEPVLDPVVTDTENVLLSDLQIPTVRQSRKTNNQPRDGDGIQILFYRSEIRRYQEEVPFELEYNESNKRYTSMTDVTVLGVNGKNNVEAKVYYVDDQEMRREILSEKVVSEPRNQVISIGTLVLPEELGITGVKGRFIKPRIDVITSPFGERESGYHSGWDIDGREGDNIYAAASGTVVTAIGPDGGETYYSGTMYTGYGYCVVIEHDNGYSTLYGHCSKIMVTLGQEVKQGEKIAEVGETGNARGTHLHFEIRQGSMTRMDPADGYMYEGKTTIYDLNRSAAATESDIKKTAG